MTKLEEVLNCLIREARFILDDDSEDAYEYERAKVQMDVVKSIRAALKDCSTLEWHPASEEPRRSGEYICVVEIYPFRKTVVSIHKWNRGWNCSSLDNILKWTELPERS